MYATNMSIEVVMQYLIGPVRWSSSAYGRTILLCHVLTFSYVTLFPLFLAPEDQPFRSSATQLTAAAALVFASAPFANVYMLPTSRRLNPAVPLLDIDVWHHVLGLSVMYAFRFTDCWTGARPFPRTCTKYDALL